jgi:Zn-dependent M28 family amino/carboxypeptidase
LQVKRFENISYNEMGMKKIRITFVSVAVIIIVYSAAAAAQDIRPVSPSDLKNWISYLASDEMRGRANGSPEMKIAAEWIAGRFSEYGLKPLLSDGSYIQSYSYTGRQKKIEERNVIGIIEGTDPVLKNEYLFLTAHFDHVGVRKGAKEDSIYNGADDNGAGTITLIAIAKALISSGVKPGRTIVFAAFSGEENGMRGSRYFVSSLTVPVKNIYADINFEMTGHSESYGKGNFYMTGCKLSDLDDVIKTYNCQGKMNLIDTIQSANSLFYASDNIAFSRISMAQDGTITGIPSGTFATTTHSPYIHSPDDEAELFDFDNMANLTSYFSKMVLWLSNNKKEISWTDPKFTRPK